MKVAVPPKEKKKKKEKSKNTRILKRRNLKKRNWEVGDYKRKWSDIGKIKRKHNRYSRNTIAPETRSDEETNRQNLCCQGWQ